MEKGNTLENFKVTHMNTQSSNLDRSLEPSNSPAKAIYKPTSLGMDIYECREANLILTMSVVSALERLCQEGWMPPGTETQAISRKYMQKMLLTLVHRLDSDGMFGRSYANEETTEEVAIPAETQETKRVSNCGV